MTLEFNGSAKVDQVLVVGNSANPLSSNNFRLYVGDSPDYRWNTECKDGPYFGPSDEDYMTNDTRLGIEVECFTNGRYISLVKDDIDTD